MSVFFPQAAMTLRVLFEDFGQKDKASLQEIYALPILARNVRVSINDYTQADTFSCEIDYKQFPFDPRCIRACGVTVHMKDMGKVFEADNTETRIKMSKEDAIFIGFADEETVTFDNDRRTVKMEGRDFTALLIDRKYIGSTIDTSQPLDKLITALLADLKETTEITLDNRVEGTLPTLGLFAEGTATLGKQRNRQLDETYWDIIQDLVGRAGLIAYIELDKLVLSKPRVLYDRKAAKRFVYGRNITDLEFKRQLGRKKNFNVMVRSLNTATKEILSAYIPAEASDEWSKATGVPNKEVHIPAINADGSKGADKPAPTSVFRVPNVNNKSHLIEIGQKIYEELGRQQIDGSFTTKEMTTLDGVNKIFDLLKLRCGTPVDIKIDQGDLKGIQQHSQLGEKTRFLIARGYDRRIAAAFAESLSNPRLNGPFYTKSVEFSLDADKGLEIKVDFINFIETPDALKDYLG
jgi:hypothetical protein